MRRNALVLALASALCACAASTAPVDTGSDLGMDALADLGARETAVSDTPGMDAPRDATVDTQPTLDCGPEASPCPSPDGALECYDLNFSRRHCGACGHECPRAQCILGRCIFECTPTSFYSACCPNDLDHRCWCIGPNYPGPGFCPDLCLLCAPNETCGATGCVPRADAGATE